jgi:cytoskeletal protein CcmA (bactofilin family)
MKTSQRLCLSAVLLAAPLSLAQPPAPPPAAEASAAPTVQVQFRGTLRDAIQKIAEEGGLNVVVTGALDTPADVHLKNVSAEQALRTVARAYSLHLEHDGDIYTLRAMTDAEKARPAVAPPLPPLPPLPSTPPLPPAPPTPSMDTASENVSLDEDELKERVRDQMKKVRRGRGSHDVVARGHSLEVKEGETVDSAVVYGGNLTVSGRVEDDAVAFGGNVEITGHVEGDVSAIGGNVVLGPSATVEGDVSAIGGTVIKRDGARVEGAAESISGAGIGRMVAGEIKNNLHEERHEEADRGEPRGGRFATFLLQFAILFGMGFLGQLFFPTRMKALGQEVRAEPLKSGVMGLLGALALVPVLGVLAVSLIGIPLAVALALVVPVLTVWGFAAVASELGARLPLHPRRKTQATVLALGLLILLVLVRLPWVGGVVLGLALLVSLGAVMRTRFGHRSQGLPEPLFQDDSIRS